MLAKANSVNSTDLAKHLGISSRYARMILAYLESLGFHFETDSYGTRRIPQCFVSALYTLRQTHQTLAALQSLTTHPELQSYLSSSQLTQLDLLIDLRTDLIILREAVAALYKAQQGSVSLPAPIDWRDLGLPDLKLDL